MFSAPYYSAAGNKGKPRDLPAGTFDGVVHETAIYQAVKLLGSNRRQGTASTKSRGQVSGGGRKPWRQKGTGRARQGTIRAPHWKGGGVVFGPTPRSYRESLPKKVRLLARRSAFNLRAQGERITLIGGFEIEEPKTKRVIDLLDRIGVEGSKLLILTDGVNRNLYLSARNLPNVRVAPFSGCSAYDVLESDRLLIELSALGKPGQSEEQDDA
ncbi:MAG: 50S ribosomal protein L4 [Longimicrobiaceae bacterium]